MAESEGKFNPMLLHIAQRHTEGIDQVSKPRDPIIAVCELQGCHYNME